MNLSLWDFHDVIEEFFDNFDETEIIEQIKDIDILNFDNYLLSYGIMEDNETVFNYIINHSSFDCDKYKLGSSNRKSKSNIMYACILCNHLKYFRSLYEHPKNNFDDNDWDIFVYIASEHGRSDILNYLLSKNDRDIKFECLRVASYNEI